MKDTPSISTTFLKFQSTTIKSDVLFVSVLDVINVGSPIDDNGEDMETVGDDLYIEDSNGDYVVLK